MSFLINGLFKGTTFLIASLPRRGQYFFGSLIGWLWFDVLRIRRSLVLDNIRQAYPEWNDKEIKRVARRSMEVIGQNVVDVALLPFLNKEKVDELFEFEGVGHVEEALKLKKGVFFLGLHLGSGDLSIASLNYMGWKINLISKEFRSGGLNKFWFNARAQHGTKFMAPRQSHFDIFRALRKNEIVIFVLDQFMGPPLGLRTKFFGRETGTAMGLAMIAGKTGSPVIPSYTYLREDGKSVIVFEKPLDFQDQSTREETYSVMTQIYTDKIEEIVRKYPEQWLWVHRRWKEFRD